MAAIAGALAAVDLRVARFEFAYMADRRSGRRRPPPRAETLIPEYRAAVDQLQEPGPLIIGGKSMGGRVASMAADELYARGEIAGLLCLGYPFHPPGKPDPLRTGHLAALQTPALICQGTRDEFGTIGEVASYPLSPRIELFWIEDGGHDLRPRKGVTGVSASQSIAALAARIRTWVGTVARR